MIDAEHGLAGDAAIAQLGADLRDITPAAFDEDGFERAVTDERGQERQIGREALLGLGPEIGKALDAGVRALDHVSYDKDLLFNDVLGDATTDAYLRATHDDIERFLARPAEPRKRTTPLPTPPGDPIGAGNQGP